MHHSGPFPLVFKSPEQGFGGKNCQNASQGKPCVNPKYTYCAQPGELAHLPIFPLYYKRIYKLSVVLTDFVCLSWEFYGPVNTLKLMYSQSVNLLTNFLGRLNPLSSLPVLVRILSPVTDNCPSWINGQERKTIEIISWSAPLKLCGWPGIRTYDLWICNQGPVVQN